MKRTINSQNVYLSLGCGLILSSCFDQPSFLSSGSGSGSLEHSASVALVESSEDADGVVSANFDPNSTDIQVLQIDSSSSLSGVSLAISPGTFSSNTELAVQEGASLASSLQVSSAGTGGVSEASVALVVTPSVKKDPAKAFSVSLPLSKTSLWLAADDFTNLAVAFKYIKYSENEAVSLGVIPPSAISIVNGAVVFNAEYFGAFQVVKTEKLVTEIKVLKTSETVVTKIAEQKAAASPSSTPSVAGAMKLFHSEYFIKNNPSDISFKLKVVGGSGSYQFTNLLLDFTPNDPATTFSLSNTGVITVSRSDFQNDPAEFRVSIKDTQTGVKLNAVPFTVFFNVYIHCLWEGWVDSNFQNPANWDFCDGAYPGASDQIAIDHRAARPLIFNQTETFGDFWPYPLGGGTMIINPNVTVNMSNGEFLSSVNIKAANNNCSTCVLNVGSEVKILDGAILTLNPGVRVHIPSYSYFRVGDSASPGSLVSLWPNGLKPVISAPTTYTFYGVSVWGANGLSRVFIEGLQVLRLDSNFVGVNFYDNYVIDKFDNVKISYQEPGSGSVNSGYPMIEFINCANSQINDLSWNGIEFDATGSGFNVSSPCSQTDLAVPGYINLVNPTGSHSSSTYQNDTNSVIYFKGVN